MGQRAAIVCEGSAFEDLVQRLTRWCWCRMVDRRTDRYPFSII